jgi:CheY-like chemotaxis protein/LmbE family N-acetylglucosaminyl deacetylase
MTRGKAKKARVLLVEDNLTDALLIRSLLEQDESLSVILAQDGIRGCELIEEQLFDLVITDINLPGRDGFEVMQECKRHQRDTPIIATSPHSDPSFRDGVFRSGANDLMTKPIDQDEFISTVRELLAVKAKTDARVHRILAIGALPGDVEAGCGGLLLKHAAAGDKVTILVLALGATGKEAQELRASSKKAAQEVGGDLILPRGDIPETADLNDLVVWVMNAVKEFAPEIVFSPSANDVRDSIKHTHMATEISADRVPAFYAYQSATTTLDFRPTMFEDVSEFLDQKMAALSHFEASAKGRPHLDPGLARAAARYWGRYFEYGEVEALEVVRHTL